MLIEPTMEKLRHLRLTGMAHAWDEQQRQPRIHKLSFDERLGLLVDAEEMQRDNRRRDRLLRGAKLRIRNACVEDVDTPSKHGLDPGLFRRLKTLSWIHECLHVVITGPAGAGKTYFACALGQLACRKGLRVYYRRATRLIDDLRLARADGSLTNLLARLAKNDLLIVDDWGVAPLKPQDARDLLEIFDDRDGARSTILASQIPTSKWHDYLGNPTVADALADRILPAAHRIVLKGNSRRATLKETNNNR